MHAGGQECELFDVLGVWRGYYVLPHGGPRRLTPLCLPSGRLPWQTDEPTASAQATIQLPPLKANTTGFNITVALLYLNKTSGVKYRTRLTE